MPKDAIDEIVGKDVQIYADGELIGNALLLDSDIEVYGGEGSESLDTTVISVPKRIENLEEAARYAYGLSETRKEIEKILGVVKKETEKWAEKITEVQDWADAEIKPLQDKLDYFSMLLTQYHIKEFSEAPNEKAQAKLKSIKLPYGVTLSSRQPAVSLEVIDETALTVYALTNDLVDLPPAKPRWAEIKKTLTVDENGVVKNDKDEVIDFIQAVPQDRKFEVK